MFGRVSGDAQYVWNLAPLRDAIDQTVTSGERERRGKDVKGRGAAAVAVSAVLVGLILGGCSSGKGTPQDGGDGAVAGASVDDFLPAVRNAICERAVACLQHPDVATCLATRIVSGGFGIPAWVSSVKRGGARFDPAAAAACLDAIPRACLVVEPGWQLTQWLGRYLTTTPCLAAFVGSAQPNERCESTMSAPTSTAEAGRPAQAGGPSELAVPPRTSRRPARRATASTRCASSMRPAAPTGFASARCQQGRRAGTRRRHARAPRPA